ncbi:MAG: alpha/beta hydrolase [bacterium]
MADWTSTAKRLSVGAGAAALGAVLLHRLRKYLYDDRERADELHHVQTDDGIQLGIWRHRPRIGEPGEPILLVHGFGLNHRHYDLNENYSLASFLANRGYDCWLVDLRGRGASQIPDDPWCFDDYIQHDIPAVIDYILKRTGMEELHWAGHSMGAMIYHAYAGTSGDQDRIASAVVTQGPFHGRTPRRRRGDSEDGNSPELVAFNNFFIPMIELFRRLRIPWTGVVRFGAFWMPQLRKIVPDQLIHILFNPDNITHENLKQASVRIVERVGPQVLAQFMDWGVNRRWTNREGDLNYRKGIQSITVPTRIVAGEIDKLCPPHNQRAGFEEIGSDSKDFITAGKENGFSADYSHLDFVHGEKAPEEIYPLFSKWFEKYTIKR